MKRLCAVAIVLTFAMPGWAEVLMYRDLPLGVRQTISDFFPDDLSIGENLADVKLIRGIDTMYGRDSYCLCFPAEEDTGGKCRLLFEVDAVRHYVAWFCREAMDEASRSALQSRDFLYSRAEVETLAREFTSERFPRPLERMHLQPVADPPASHSGNRLPVYMFHWRGYVGEAETGDQLSMSVSPNTGDVLLYRARPALDFSEDDVVVSRNQAIAAVRAEIEEVGTVDLDEVTFRAKLVLSHPQTKGEGPAWRITASRPPLVGIHGCQTHRFVLRPVDARTGRVIRPHDLKLWESAFFRTE